MSLLAPPGSPLLVALADDDRRRHFQFRHWLLVWSVVTILVTGWLCTLGPIPAILALVIAKHILVALLVAGLGVDQPQQTHV